MGIFRAIRPIVLAALLLAAPLWTGCDNESDPGTIGTKAILVVYFEPNPTAIDIDGKWRYVVYVSEINGVGVSIYGWNVERFSDSDISLGSGTGSQAEFEAQYVLCGGEGTYLPGGQTRCSARFYERVANAGYLVYTFFGVDDNGNEVEGEGRLDLN